MVALFVFNPNEKCYKLGQPNFSLLFYVPTLVCSFTFQRAHSQKKVIINLNQSSQSKRNLILHSNRRKINFALQSPQNKFCTLIAAK
ncbi:MAG: hypothetical protein DRR16_20890 [Candidatus Parabeggiatoa sp. nov. 3]|nr:MAG: hypothetical protein DRR16_20890 [Gammaproteobacteria bacterium]